MTILFAFFGWILLSIILSSFVGTMIAFGTGSLDETKEND